MPHAPSRYLAPTLSSQALLRATPKGLAPGRRHAGLGVERRARERGDVRDLHSAEIPRATLLVRPGSVPRSVTR